MFIALRKCTFTWDMLKKSNMVPTYHKITVETFKYTKSPKNHLKWLKIVFLLRQKY